MSNYTITTNFGAKDSLPSGDSNKVIKGSEFTTEFTNIQTAIATKADTSGASFTGAVTLSDSLTTTANINLGNSDKLVFGNTGQLQIYTDGTDSFITESGSGSLKIKGNFLQLLSPDDELYFVGTADGSSSLFYNGITHLATRLNGVSVYGGFDVDTDTLYVDYLNDRVGINTASPSTALHVAGGNTGTDQALFRTSSGGGGGLQIVCSDLSVANPLWSINTFYGEELAFGDGTDEHMRIDSSGNVGIGIANPPNTLTVGGLEPSAIFAEATVGIKCDANHKGIILQENSGAEQWEIGVGAAGGLKFYDSGSATPAVTFADITGNVGIGTDNPLRELEVTGTGNVYVKVTAPTADDSAGLELANTGATWLIQNDDTSNEALTFDRAGTEVMRIDSSGKVGIGTTNPDSQFVLQDTNGCVSKIAATDGGSQPSATAQLVMQGFEGRGAGIFIQDSKLSASNPNDRTWFIGTGYSTDNFGIGYAADGVNTHYSAQNMLSINTSGTLLVGTTEQNAFNGGFTVKTGTVPYINVGHASTVASGNYYAAFRHGTNTLGTITQNGTTGVLYNTSSDERLKENITDSADAGSKIDAIQIRQFDWKVDGSHQDYGVIAQELVEVAPEAVHQPEDSEEMMGVDYSKLVPMLVKEVQSLRSRVAELENN